MNEKLKITRKWIKLKQKKETERERERELYKVLFSLSIPLSVQMYVYLCSCVFFVCACIWKADRHSANTANIERWSLTYNRNFTTASSTMTLFISRPTRVHTGIILFLHWAYHQRPIWLNFLTYIVGQFTTACADTPITITAYNVHREVDL